MAARFRERASPSNSPSSAHSPTTLPSVVASVHKLPTSISAPELKPTVRSDQLPRFAVAAGQRSRAPSIHRIEQLSSKGYVPPRRSRVNNAGGGSAASMRSDATAAGRTRIGLLARDPHLIDKLAGAAGVATLEGWEPPAAAPPKRKESYTSLQREAGSYMKPSKSVARY